ncbi:hypothetical protein CHS0354_009695 [Potamilus streckersoni]|uniref:Uncharacterized protein n=1 Tax=Potamilus streckersoni TaxID=2493646 RepID=A0AAE0S0K6_9BIVA|nr:hypothetical protein CHS0354_009695 [Potamilus streckersoni]
MDQIYISASAQLEKILKDNAKAVSSDEKNKLTILIKDLKAEVQNKRERAKKFEALEKSLKTKSALVNQIADIRKSLDDGSMSIVGKANISVPPGQKASDEEHTFQLLDELYKQASAIKADLLIEKTDTSTTEKTAKGGKGKGNTPTKMESHQVSDKIKSVSSVLTEMGETVKQVKKLKHESDFLSGLLDALYDSLIGGEDKMSNKQSSASSGIEQSRFDKAIKIMRTFQEKEREEEHTTRLLEQLYKQTTAVNDGQVKYQTDKPKKDNTRKGKDRKDVQGSKKTETDAKLNHDDKFEIISSTLKKLDEVLKWSPFRICGKERKPILKTIITTGGRSHK